MKVLLDNDVVLDFLTARQPFFVEAEESFQPLDNGKIDCYVSAITPVNVFYIVRKISGKVIALQSVKDLLNAVEVCQTDFQTLQNATNSLITDYEDAVQHECAMIENLDAIITRNAKDFANAIIKVYSPTEFLQLLNAP
jgi:predicted nucleic acid-binding protein